VIGLINGSFYALLNSGLARHLRHAKNHNFTPAPSTDGAFTAFPCKYGRDRLLVAHRDVSLGVANHRDHSSSGGSCNGSIRSPFYGLLLTFGLALFRGTFRNYSVVGCLYSAAALQGGQNLGVMVCQLSRCGGGLFAPVCLDHVGSQSSATREARTCAARPENHTLVRGSASRGRGDHAHLWFLSWTLDALAGVDGAPIYKRPARKWARTIIVVFAGGDRREWARSWERS